MPRLCPTRYFHALQPVLACHSVSFLSAGQFSHTLYMGEDKERKVSLVVDSLLVRRWSEPKLEVPCLLDSVADAGHHFIEIVACLIVICAADCTVLSPAGAVYNSLYNSLSERVSSSQGRGSAAYLLSPDAGLTSCMASRGPPSWRA